MTLTVVSEERTEDECLFQSTVLLNNKSIFMKKSALKKSKLFTISENDVISIFLFFNY